MKSQVSDWRSVRLWERGIEQHLRARHPLWMYGWLIGLAVLGLMWGAAHLQMMAGLHSLALRYLLTLGIGYLFYLLVLRWWAGALVDRSSLDISGLDGPGISHSPSGPDLSAVDLPGMHAGGGGDFAGGGATGDFSAGGGDFVGGVAQGAVEIAAGSEEGAVVVVPVVAVFLIGLALIFGAGSLLMLYFGWEALLTAAVEIAFSYVSARTAMRVVREGWLSAVVRLTWKPLLGAVACAVLLGGAIDYFIPAANSLPQAIHMIRASR
ncbi:hypothetical protein GHT07_05615 [Caenimonas koreensis DSM 17982]|uniref:Transmembrane protein n=1 Tax=Caenimonas koreensis DSM 17982 TaxID=1121255 RepID=A0A844B0U0_9BURK|nr:hypothetical protein [Caenimonas koreensis]MRD46743.1 hypothetical protein [Caenimonas koreensis DSM 17982]